MNIVIRPPLPEILDPPLIKGHVYYTSRLRVTEMLGGMSCKAFFIQQCCQSFNSLNAQVHIYMHSHVIITICVLCFVLIIKMTLDTIVHVHTCTSVQYTDMHVTM